MTVMTIYDMMNETSIGKMFSNVHNLITLYLTIPLTSATAEHTFSTLHQLTMIQEQQNHVIHVLYMCYIVGSIFGVKCWISLSL